jgi:hypothetical protein
MKARKPLRSKPTVVQVFQEIGQQLAQQETIINSDRRLRRRLQFLLEDAIALVGDARMYSNAPYHNPHIGPRLIPSDPHSYRSAPKERHPTLARMK